MSSYYYGLQDFLNKYLDYIVVVEGKKDVASLEALGFLNVHAIHITGVPIRERVMQISSILGRKDRVCILTDFDKKGKQMYFLLKKEFQGLGARVDSTLRTILLRTRVSQMEGLYEFVKKTEMQ